MNRLLNVGQLALALRLPREWLESEAQGGHIPCLRVGDRLRFNLEAVEQALAARAAKSVGGTAKHTREGGKK